MASSQEAQFIERLPASLCLSVFEHKLLTYFVFILNSVLLPIGMLAALQTIP